MSDSESPPTSVPAEPVEAKDPKRLAHLSELRPLIIRRSLLAAGLSGLIPVPVMDEYVAGRVRAGLYLKIAGARHVDLPQPAADLLSDRASNRYQRACTAHTQNRKRGDL